MLSFWNNEFVKAEFWAVKFAFCSCLIETVFNNVHPLKSSLVKNIFPLCPCDNEKSVNALEDAKESEPNEIEQLFAIVILQTTTLEFRNALFKTSIKQESDVSMPKYWIFAVFSELDLNVTSEFVFVNKEKFERELDWKEYELNSVEQLNVCKIENLWIEGHDLNE